MKLLPEFVEAVKAEKIKGLAWQEEDWTAHPDEYCVEHIPWGIVDDSGVMVNTEGETCVWQADHLCAHLRRVWLKLGYGHTLDSDSWLTLSSPNEHVASITFSDRDCGSILEAHQRAALWVIEQEAE